MNLRHFYFILLSLIFSVQAQPSDSIGQFPGFFQILNDYQVSWSYVPPEGFPASRRDLIKQQSQEMKEELEVLSSSDAFLGYTQLQKRIFLEIYGFKSTRFFVFKSAYENILKVMQRASSFTVLDEEQKNLQLRATFYFEKGSSYHSKLAREFISWCEDVRAMNINKLLVMDYFFQFARKAESLNAGPLLEHMFSMLMDHEGSSFTEKQVSDLKELVDSTEEVLQEIKSQKNTKALKRRQAILHEAMEDYWANGELAALRALRKNTCYGLFAIGS